MACLTRKLSVLPPCLYWHRAQILVTASRQLSMDVKHSTNSFQPDQFCYEKILSDHNKSRVQNMLHTVKPARTLKHVQLHPEHGSAAVLVPLCTVNQEPSLLFTLRSKKLAKYRGQVSFPGGNVDASDPDVRFTALRETEEELGICPTIFDVWGQMNALPASSGQGKMVYPILARTGEIDINRLKLNHDEVDKVFTVTLRHLCDPDNVRSTRFRSKHSYTIPVYIGLEHRVWGFTAIVTHMLLTMLVPDLYKFKLKHQHSYRGS